MSEEPEVETEEIRRVLRLYAGPPWARAHAPARAPRRLVLAFALVAVVSAGAVLGIVTGVGRDRTHAALAPTGCTSTLVLGGTQYVEGSVTAQLRIGRALGRGVLRPCGSAQTSVGARALAGIDTRRAVGARGAVYVARPCARVAAARLLSCLRATR